MPEWQERVENNSAILYCEKEQKKIFLGPEKLLKEIMLRESSNK